MPGGFAASPPSLRSGGLLLPLDPLPAVICVSPPFGGNQRGHGYVKRSEAAAQNRPKGRSHEAVAKAVGGDIAPGLDPPGPGAACRRCRLATAPVPARPPTPERSGRGTRPHKGRPEERASRRVRSGRSSTRTSSSATRPAGPWGASARRKRSRSSGGLRFCRCPVPAVVLVSPVLTRGTSHTPPHVVPPGRAEGSVSPAYVKPFFRVRRPQASAALACRSDGP